MRILPEILLITAGLSLGFFIASGLVALVIGLGIVTRYAGITKTAGSLRFLRMLLYGRGAVRRSFLAWHLLVFPALLDGRCVLAFCGHFIWEAGSSRSAKSSTCFRSSAAGSD